MVCVCSQYSSIFEGKEAESKIQVDNFLIQGCNQPTKKQTHPMFLIEWVYMILFRKVGQNHACQWQKSEIHRTE